MIFTTLLSGGITLLQGLYRLMENGYKFTSSQACDQELEDYKCANDSLYKFIKENYIITYDKKDRVKKTYFENEYFRWANMNDVQALERKNIKDRAAKHGIISRTLDGYPCYQGIKKI
jgi:phage/plasmid-associated DNA primase